MRSRSIWSSAALGLALCAACGGGGSAKDPGLAGLELTSLAPATVVPGSNLVVTGRSFVGSSWGASQLRLVGELDGESVDLALPATFEDFDTLGLRADAAFFARFPAPEGDFTGTAAVEVESRVDGELYRSEAIDVELALRQELTPRLTGVASGELLYVNDEIAVEGEGFLLGGTEGQTLAILEGCFEPAAGGGCEPVSAVDVPVVPESAHDRTRGRFAFVPGIAGIEPGRFEGTVVLRNEHGSGAARDSDVAEVDYELIEPEVFELSTAEASLGQYVDVRGGGFLGGAAGGVTTLEVSGSFAPDGGADPVSVDLVLVPEFERGRLVRYVLSEDDELGQSVDLRRTTGTFSGTITPESRFEGQVVVGAPADFELRLAPVKQVVHLVFEPSYVESLRHFGLRALDARLRQRVAAVVARDFAGIHLELRLEEPTDFALYSVVEVAGPDPNGLGLLGYDNSPGKDTNNERLYDRIGGVNAMTQEDGAPGYGGVFIESLFAFSQHPGGFAAPIAGADESFDDIFDPFRPDRGGTPVSSADLAGAPPLDRGDACPAEDRAGRVSCAEWVLGNLIGTTLSHEIGHSLGLANPFGQGFHNPSDELDRLMDTGGDRPFHERAELYGEGPGRFCDGAYDYLRAILPTDAPSDAADRPTCF